MSEPRRRQSEAGPQSSVAAANTGYQGSHPETTEPGRSADRDAPAAGSPKAARQLRREQPELPSPPEALRRLAEMALRGSDADRS